MNAATAVFRIPHTVGVGASGHHAGPRNVCQTEVSNTGVSVLVANEFACSARRVFLETPARVVVPSEKCRVLNNPLCATFTPAQRGRVGDAFFVNNRLCRREDFPATKRLTNSHGRLSLASAGTGLSAPKCGVSDYLLGPANTSTERRGTSLSAGFQDVCRFKPSPRVVFRLHWDMLTRSHVRFLIQSGVC